MKKYQVTWGWEPPVYDKPKGNFRLFYHSQQIEREVIHINHETNEEEKYTITEWLCDVVEYDKTEANDIFRMLKENRDSIECQRWILTERINAYDNSKYVNSFTIGDKEVWLDKATRVGLKLRFEAEIRLGKTETTLWQDRTGYPLPLTGTNNALDMLDGIELYASYCYDNTQNHLAKTFELNAEEMKTYDYTVGYPEKLRF